MLPKISLKNTDLVVSALCYGTNALGTAYDQAASNALLDQFAALGGNFIDTARSYGDWIPDIPAGASERAIGAWLQGKDRQDFVIATKGGMVDMRKGDWRPRVTPEDIAQDLGESLAHLGISSIDLYWLHSDNPQAPVGPVIDALIAAQKSGQIRYFGASNWTPARIEEAQAYAASIGHQGFAAVQPFWGLAVPNPEAAAAAGYGFYYADGLQKLHASGLTMIPYSGQSRGFFSKLADGEDGIRDDVKAMFLNDINRARFAVVRKLASQLGVSINAIVLAYLTSQPLQTIPIVGAFRADQLDETVTAAALTLSAAELKALEAGPEAMEAYPAICNQLSRFARTLDSRDWDAVPGIFAADISFDYGEGEQSGLPALLTQFSKYLDVCGPTQHLIGSIQLHQDGVLLRSRAYVQARHQGKAGLAGRFFDSNGDYIDQWEQRDGAWLIRRRQVVWLMHMGDPAVLGFKPD